MEEYENIISFLYNKTRQDCLLEEESKLLEKERKKTMALDKNISKYIDEKVHPHSKQRLKELINDYTVSIMGSVCIEKELAYKNGFSDAMKMVLVSLTNRL